MSEGEKRGIGHQLFLSQNNYLNGMQCLRYAWYYKHRHKALPSYPEATERVFNYGHMIGAKARELYPGGILACEKPRPFGEQLEYCRGLLEKRLPLFECGLIFNNAYAQSDILLPLDDNAWEFIEVKSGRGIAEVNYHDVAFQRYVYSNAGLDIRRCYIMHVTPGSKAGEHSGPGGIFTKVDVTEALASFSAVVPDKVREIRETLSSPEPPDVPAGGQCTNPYRCRMFDVCNTAGKEGTG
ncbi:MAG: hypothetical protein JW808_05135 [Victivallales bacterium]|nr:hypothetical protein [Victivallales bacterium]